MSEVFYVIAVHGIGDQRYNETVLPVINGFAKAKSSDIRENLISLGMVNNQTGTIYGDNGDVKFTRSINQKMWSEFAGIPSQGDKIVAPADGSASHSGENFRFIDMFWADLLDADAARSAQPVEQWTEGVIARNSRKCEDDKSNGNLKAAKSREWLIKLLHIVNEVILFVNSFLSFKGKGIQEVVFNKYLSDVQVYGEHLNVRGRAVSRFHKMMQAVHDRHFEEEEKQGTNRKPRFIFLAHSLGTVLTMDALCYAHVDHQKLTDRFPSYHTEGDSTEEIKYNYDWTKYVKTLITLGSPIDKYIVLWWQNYDYLKNAALYKKRENKILHINYTDEQDPVGHKLDKFRETSAYDNLFYPKTVEAAEVFKRYGVPGKAHVDYWEDKGLIDNLLSNISDDQYQNEDNAHLNIADKKYAYTKSVAISYFVVPFVAAWVTGRLFASGFSEWTSDSPDWEVLGLLGIGFMASAYFFQKLIRILIFWRVILFSKSKDEKNGKAEYYDKGKRFLVRLTRFAILALLLVAYYALAWPVFSAWNSSWKDLAIYFAVLFVLYGAFKGMKKLLVPAVKSAPQHSKYRIFLLSIIGSAVLFYLPSMLPVFDFFKTPLKDSGALVLSFALFAWVYNMVTVWIYKKEIAL